MVLKICPVATRSQQEVSATSSKTQLGLLKAFLTMTMTITRRNKWLFPTEFRLFRWTENLGIPFRILPRKRKHLGIPFRRTKIEANSRNSVPNPCAEEKKRFINQTDQVNVMVSLYIINFVGRVWIHKFTSIQDQERITHKSNRGVGEKKTYQKKERKSTNKKAKTEQIQQEQQHQYTGDIIFFRMQRSSYRVQRSSLGCSVAQKDAA